MVMLVRVGVRTTDKVVEVLDPDTNQVKQITIKHYEPDIANIKYVIKEIDYNNLTAVIEIDDSDYDKIKDKVIEVITTT